ncbi:MAG: hypothetical protein JST19_07160 [Bacteroidetes bacterium]|nr:hypothetical protein [Bacteroidota bacterium]
MTFSLHKTYLDCVDDAGNCFILYDASIRLLFLKIGYSALVFSDRNNNLTEISSFRRSNIAKNDRRLSFSNKRLKISGQWDAAGHPVESLLYRHGKGIVHWDCHHPSAHCIIDYQGHHFSGLGYGETLFLSIKLWRLPIEELKWGRFLAPGIAITWIQWKGKNPINRIYLNGRKYNDAEYGTHSVIFNGGTSQLEFSRISCISQAKFSGHLSKMPLLKLFLNKATLNSLESKYKAKSTFRDAGGVIHHGWVIFEVVKWEH